MSRKPQQISVIVTTYNRLDSLLWVLQGLAAQDYQAFQVIIADDGSRAATKNAVLQTAWPFALFYAWQADLGFRAAQARNLALTYATGDYVVFLDGDTVPQTDFIRRHYQLAECGYFVAGQRILCSQTFSQAVLAKQIPLWRLSVFQGLRYYLAGNINRFLPLIHVGDGFWRRFNQDWRGAMSCNLGLWREDLLAINGFEQQYQGWGHEDADLVVRLLRHGIKRKQGRFATAVLHLWHPENDRSQEADNQQRLQQLLKNKRIHAHTGYQSPFNRRIPCPYGFNYH